MADEAVKKGDKIKVTYTGYLEDGSVFDLMKVKMHYRLKLVLDR